MKKMRIMTGSGVAPVPLSDVSNKVIAATGTTIRPLQNVFDSDRDQHKDDEVSIIGAAAGNGDTDVETVDKDGVPFFLAKRGTKRRTAIVSHADPVPVDSLMDMRRKEHEMLVEEHKLRMETLAAEKAYWEMRGQQLRETWVPGRMIPESPAENAGFTVDTDAGTSFYTM